jgi:hypothetical protein
MFNLSIGHWQIEGVDKQNCELGTIRSIILNKEKPHVCTSIADLDPDPYVIVLEPPGFESGSISTRYGS